MVIEKHGRAQLEGNSFTRCILVKERLEDTFDLVVDEQGNTLKGRPVKHVGDKKYIMEIWNKMLRNKKYLENPKTIHDIMGSKNV
jgi:hypothetical protein